MTETREFAEQLVAEYTSGWCPEDWENESVEQLVEQAEQLLLESPELVGDMFYACFAFERHMVW